MINCEQPYYTIKDKKRFNVEDVNITRMNQNTGFGNSLLNVSSAETVTFRFYGFGAEGEAGTWRLDSIRIYGSITILPVSTNETKSSLDPLCNCDLKIKIYPNPGNNELNVENKAKGKLNFVVYSGVGEEMKLLKNAQEFEQLDTKSWPAGVYNILIKETGKTIRWIKY